MFAFQHNLNAAVQVQSRLEKTGRGVDLPVEFFVQHRILLETALVHSTLARFSVECSYSFTFNIYAVCIQMTRMSYVAFLAVIIVVRSGPKVLK